MLDGDGSGDRQAQQTGSHLEETIRPHHLCDKDITVLAFTTARANTMWFIMLTFVKEVSLKFRVLLLQMLCCDSNVGEEVL